LNVYGEDLLCDYHLKFVSVSAGVHPVTGVYRAAYSGSHGEIMRLLTAQGYGVLSQLDANGCSPLMYAVMADSKPAIEALMSFSAKKELVRKL
jgi:ankyrin repeat protein